jgi:hypothetical protein
VGVSSQRIELEPEEIAGLIRGSRLLELRVDTPPEVRQRWIETAMTAMDALCGLADRRGTDGVWDVLAMISHRELLAFSTLMASELASTGFSLAADEEQAAERAEAGDDGAAAGDEAAAGEESPTDGEGEDADTPSAPVEDPGRPESMIQPRGI